MLGTFRSRRIWAFSVNENTTRREHHVWSHYLEGWCRDGKLCCMRDGNLFWTSPPNIMVERDFYRLIPFSKQDVALFDYWITEKCSSAMRVANRSTFSMFLKVANGKEIVQRSNKVTKSEKQIASSLAIQLEEMLHGDIENRAVPLMKKLRQERLDFLSDDQSTVSFFSISCSSALQNEANSRKCRTGSGIVESRIRFQPASSRVLLLFC